MFLNKESISSDDSFIVFVSMELLAWRADLQKQELNRTEDHDYREP